MTTQVLTGLLLLVLPVAYNGLYTLLARSFDYPDILRQPTSQVLERFTAGGSRLVLHLVGVRHERGPARPGRGAAVGHPRPTPTRPSWPWPPPSGCWPPWCSSWAWSAGRSPSRTWPASPVTRRPPRPPGTPSRSTFQTLNRYLGVAVGEHLGYLFTGLWTALAGVALIQSDLLHPLFGIIGLLLAPLFVLGSLEFVGPFEVRGWKLAGTLVPLAYIGWSVWLLALGIGLLSPPDQHGADRPASALDAPRRQPSTNAANAMRWLPGLRSG